MKTNSGSAVLALVLQSAPSRATFTSVITRKVGTTRGAGAEKKLYGDDLVHAVVVTGFRYDRLVERSKEALAGLRAQSAQIAADLASKDAYEGKGSNQVKVVITEAHVLQAMDELAASFVTTLDPSAPSESTTDHVFEPLVVDGETVKGGRVYKCAKDVAPKCHCRDCSGDAKAPKDGTVYLQGLQIGSKVIEAAANGPVPASKSGPVVVAKDYLRRKLPVGRYASYKLTGDFLLKVGGTAAMKVDQDGVHLTDDLANLLSAAA